MIKLLKVKLIRIRLNRHLKKVRKTPCGKAYINGELVDIYPHIPRLVRDNDLTDFIVEREL